MHSLGENIEGFELLVDRYDGITIKEDGFHHTNENFPIHLDKLVSALISKEYRLLWIYLDIKQSELIPLCINLGFEFHTCETKKILLVKKLQVSPIIPTAANHTLGVGVVVINDKNELLVIKEKHTSVGFKLPGGHVDDEELIQSAVAREVYEETGIKVEFSSIVSLGHFYPHQFNKSNLYILCKAKALSQIIDIKDTEEIIDAKWMDVDEFLNNPDGFPYNQHIVRAAIEHDGLSLKELNLRYRPDGFELFFPS